MGNGRNGFIRITFWMPDRTGGFCSVLFPPLQEFWCLFSGQLQRQGRQWRVSSREQVTWRSATFCAAGLENLTHCLWRRGFCLPACAHGQVNQGYYKDEATLRHLAPGSNPIILAFNRIESLRVVSVFPCSSCPDRLTRYLEWGVGCDIRTTH